MMDVRGTYYFTDNERYEGEFQQGKKHGRGTYHMVNGDRFEGEYINDLRHGKGTYYSYF